MGFKCGIVGLPNVGKSTLFNALTKAEIEAANYPFCTIEPNTGIVQVPDERLDNICDIVMPDSVIPTIMEFVDIAGLVSGASKGEGLGNKFLSHIRETDAIAHVVRCFDDDNIVHVEGRVNPLEDVTTIQTELALADMEVLERALERVAKKVRIGDKSAQKHQSYLTAAYEHLSSSDAYSLLTASFDEQTIVFLKSFNLITLKPMLYIANVAESDLDGNSYTEQLASYCNKQGAQMVVICADIEAEIMSLDDEEKRLFLDDLGLKSSGLDRVIHSGYQQLDLDTFFTAGKKEVRAWTIKKGMCAPQAAGRIHTDFEQGFIRAEIMSYEDYIQYQGEAGCKEAGKWRLEGKDYRVKDGDIIHFRFNV